MSPIKGKNSPKAAPLKPRKRCKCCNTASGPAFARVLQWSGSVLGLGGDAPERIYASQPKVGAQVIPRSDSDRRSGNRDCVDARFDAAPLQNYTPKRRDDKWRENGVFPHRAALIDFFSLFPPRCDREDTIATSPGSRPGVPGLCPFRFPRSSPAVTPRQATVRNRSWILDVLYLHR